MSTEFYVQLFESGNEKLIDSKKIAEIIEKRNFIKKDDNYEVIFANQNSTTLKSVLQIALPFCDLVKMKH